MHNTVETTHYNLTSVVMQVIACEPSMYTDKEKWLAILPMFHMYGALCFMFLSRKSGFFWTACYLLTMAKHSVMRPRTFFPNSNQSYGLNPSKNTASQQVIIRITCPLDCSSGRRLHILCHQLPYFLRRLAVDFYCCVMLYSDAIRSASTSQQIRCVHC